MYVFTKQDCSSSANYRVDSDQLDNCHFVQRPQQVHRWWRTLCVRGRRLCILPLKRICSHSHHTPRNQTPCSLLSERQSTRKGRTPCSLLQPWAACNVPLFLFEIQIQSWTSWSEQFPQLKWRGRSKEKLRQWLELAFCNFPLFSSNQLLRLWVKLSRVHCPYQHFICWYRRQGTERLSSSLCTLCLSRLNKSQD